MSSLFSILLVIIFAGIGVLHFIWAGGGRWGYLNSLPAKEDGELLMAPKSFDCALVGAGLCLFASFYWFNLVSPSSMPDWMTTYGIWIIPAIFTLRGIGDFKYVGIFKSVKSTTFGRLDSKYFSPICLLISAFGLYLAYGNLQG